MNVLVCLVWVSFLLPIIEWEEVHAHRFDERHAYKGSSDVFWQPRGNMSRLIITSSEQSRCLAHMKCALTMRALCKGTASPSRHA